MAHQADGLTQPSRLVTALLGAGIVALIVAGVAVLVFVEFGDSPTTSAAPTGQQTSDSNPSAGAPQPVTDACSLVTLDAVAAAIGAKASDVKAEPGTQALGLKCDFKAPEGEDVLTGFSIQLTDVGDAAFARSTIEGRRGGKRIDGVGELAVLEQSEVGSSIFVVKGARYVQLRTQRKPASDDAMVSLAKEAAAKL